MHLPKRADFKSMQEFYSTALHEIGHSTGHESRLMFDCFIVRDHIGKIDTIALGGLLKGKNN